MQEKRPRSTTISSTTVSSMPPGAPGALPVLPLGMCWQLQDGPDYHLSWGRGQGRLRRCGGVLWAFKRRKCVEIAKRALLAHLGLEHAGKGVKPYAVYGFTWRLTGGELSLGIGHAIEAWGRFRGALRITGRRVR